MSTFASPLEHESLYPVHVRVDPALGVRDRLTTAFRVILAIPHLILVGGPIAGAISWTWRDDSGTYTELSSGAGVLGVVAWVAAMISWFAILFTGRQPSGLWNLIAYYMRWRVRATAYVALFRDEYPPFGEGAYPATLDLAAPAGERDRVAVAFRLILAIPQLIAVCALGIAWGFTSVIAWFAILFTGRYPAGLYQFGVHVFQWTTRVEAYVLLLRDEYPPFSFD